MTLRLTEHVVRVGEALEALRGLPDESVHCCVTSPPYYGLRDYQTAEWEGGNPECDHKNSNWDRQLLNDGGNRDRTTPMRGSCSKCGARRVDDQLGLESTPEEYVTRLVEVFREVRRVLRADGTLWLNLGDSYNSRPGGEQGETGQRADRTYTANQRSFRPGSGRADGILDERGQRNRNGVSAPGLKPKDLCGIPWRVAFALQADGWYLRSDIIWAKPNPMPESVRDRPTKAHEYIFLLTKSERYFWDQEAVREKGSEWPDHNRFGNKDAKARLAERLTGNMAPDSKEDASHRSGRNIRSVWTITTKPFPEAHFATFPPELPRRCILAGTSERGCCSAPVKRLRLRADLTYEERERVYSRLKGSGLA